MPNKSNLARLEGLEQHKAPYQLLANYRFITHINVRSDDPLNGTHEHVSFTNSPIKELRIFAETRGAYKQLKNQFEQDYFLMEG